MMLSGFLDVYYAYPILLPINFKGLQESHKFMQVYMTQQGGCCKRSKDSVFISRRVS